MNEVNWVEMETEIFSVITAAVMLIIQLVLCFKAHKLWLRILPACLCAVASAVFFIVSFFSDGWDAIGFLFLTIFFAVLLLVCGIGWGVWAIVCRMCRLR